MSFMFVSSECSKCFCTLTNPDPEHAGPQGENGEDENENASPSKQRRRAKNTDMNPESTLEATLEALNIKKFDLAFAVDPLFHKTSAQFDEGGAKGLLLNNLSVYRGCEIVFDSMDIPDANVELSNAESAGMENSSVALEALVSTESEPDSLQSNLKHLSSPPSAPISPTLDAILALLKNPESEPQQENGGTCAQESAAQALVNQVASGQYVNATLEDGADEGADNGDGDGAEALMDELNSFASVLDIPPPTAPPPPADDDEDEQPAPCDDGAHFPWDDEEMDVDDRSREKLQIQKRTTATSMSRNHEVHALDDDAISWLIAASAPASAQREGGGSSASSSFLTAAKGWAGTSHWKYRHAVLKPVVEGEDDGDDDEGNDEGAAKAPKRRGRVAKRNQPIDFVALMDVGNQKTTTNEEGPSIPLLLQSKKLLKKNHNSKTQQSLAENSRTTKTLLPEDYHCGLQMLSRYALRPRTTVQLLQAGRRSFALGNGGGDMGEDDDEPGFDIGYDDGYDETSLGVALHNASNSLSPFSQTFSADQPDVDQLAERMTLLGLEAAQAAHKVEKVEVNYSRAAKQVDVKALKELMWSGLNTVAVGSKNDCIDFDQVLATVPSDNPAGRVEDLSVHLCFICMLHLANEHGLQIQGTEGLDALSIRGVVSD